MKTQSFTNKAGEFADALPSSGAPGQKNAADQGAKQSQQSPTELTELKCALAANQQQLKAACRKIEMLMETNASLRQKLARLAEMYVRARRFAFHDELTGLPNRCLLLNRLKQAMAQSARQHKRVVLLFIDLDKFKAINDNLGHLAGDRILQQVAQRLAANIRFCDTACRYGGDEFLVMLPEINGEEDVAIVTDKIRAQLAKPYLLDGRTIGVSASIGVAVYRTGEQNSDDLIKQADIAMYHAKNGVQHKGAQPS